MSFGEQSRMSQLKDRNIYLQTDQLYEPLRNALRKSSVSQSSISNELTNSRVGRNMRSLSPTEAQLIKRSLYIPINKELVPTRNLDKVMGKSFTAVDFNETVKQPLTAEQFSRVKLDSTEQIIYEIKQSGNESSSIYTSRLNVPHQNVHLSTSRIVGQSRVVQPSSRKSQIKFVTTPHQPVRSNPINLYTQPVVKRQGYSFTIRPSESRQKNIPIAREGAIRTDRYQFINQQFIVFGRQNSQLSINKSLTSIKALRNDAKAKEDAQSQIKTVRDSKSQFYQFRTKNSDRASNRSRSREYYKYNLCNGVNQANNLDCNRLACCTNMDLSSSKASTNPWK